MTTATRTLTTRRLGSTDLELTTVGFGAWAIGGGGWAHGWGPQDDTDSIEAILHAVDRGVNWIDTAGDLRARSFGRGRRPGAS